MRITKTQLSKLIRDSLKEANYYTKKFTLGEDESAKKFESDFDDNSTVPWTGSYNEEEKSVVLKTSLDFSVNVKIYEPKGSQYSVLVFYGDSDKALIRKENLSSQDLKSFIENIDDVVIEVIASRIKKGAR